MNRSLVLFLACALLLPLAVAPGALPTGPVCLFRVATGMPCPSCGLTHAYLAAGHGEWRLSLEYHPLGPLLWLGAAGFLIAQAGRALGGFPGRRPRPASCGIAAGFAGMLLIAVWLLRLAAGTLTP
jgi:uncharacterized protein DUF2752